jgi:ABC-type transport system involved in Fe-S cluster assembly fused permease/ATPase subunit
MAETSTTTIKDLRILRLLLPLLWRQAERGLRRRLVAGMLLILATAALGAAAPVLFKRLVDAFSGETAANPLVIPVLLIVAYALAHWLGRTVAELRWFTYGRFEQSIQRQLALLLFDHIHRLSLRFHLGRRTGGLQQTVANGLLGYRLVLFHGLFVVLPLAVELALVGAVLVGFYSPIFLVIVLATAGLYVVSFVIGVERQRAPQREATNAYIDAFARSADSYLNYETIKYFGGEDHVRGQFDDALRRGVDGWSRFYVFRTLTGLAQAVWLALGLGGLAFFAARSVAGGSMTLGDFVLVNTYMLQLWRPLDNLGFAYREIKMGLTYVEHLLELLDEDAEIADAPGALPLAEGPGEIVFAGVDFAYDARRTVLEQVNFRTPAGHTLAVVGPSGSGKSTLSRLLFRFYDTTGGHIAIDGQRLGALTLQSLRAAIAVVPQDTPLFNDSLAYNIGFGRPGASRGEIEAAARLAQIHDFIAGLPDGYDTVVGERGLKLSGGEKQRVAIARAVLKQPRIFVFDEATSALDSKTERAIQRDLQTVLAGTTTLIIAHRLSTIVHADEILVLVAGRVVERGGHSALLAAGGAYAGMWHQQQQAAAERDANYA